MAQDDPVVSAQWLHEHLGMPDVKVKKKVIYLIVHIQFRDTLIMLPSLKKKFRDTYFFCPLRKWYVENTTGWFSVNLILLLCSYYSQKELEG
jgi:hypothetical protein